MKLRELSNEIAGYVNENGENIFADQLIKDIRSGKELSEDQKQLLRLMGFDKNGIQSQNQEEERENDKNSYQLNNINSDLLRSYGITGIKRNVDKDGNEY